MADGDGAARKRQKDESTYVLQVAFEVVPAEAPEGDAGEDEQPKTQIAWYDAATVTVPAGTKRATVRQKALQKAGIMPPLGAPPVQTRLLDEQSAEETPVESELQLRIGGGS